MTDVRDELWAALLEVGKVRWMPGMLARRATGPCQGSHRYIDAEIRAGVVWARGAPDWNDPATLGCLTAMAREAWKNDIAIMVGQGWHQIEPGTGHDYLGDGSNYELTRDLLRAIKAAP